MKAKKINSQQSEINNKQTQTILQTKQNASKSQMVFIQGRNQTFSQKQFQYDSNHQFQKIEKQNIQIVYRPDIDGLRAIAIAFVVIFHSWPQFLTGGFIGVDIFFVISGYLISSIIIKQLNKNSFSYINFYRRRIKRIFPALILVITFVFMFSYKFLEKRQYEIVNHTMTSATVFSANLQILTYQKGYFDPDVKTNSLLHLWSLGVQQQFYIFWPFIISILIKFFTKRGFILLLSFTIISFSFSIFSIYEINQKFAFYFPFCRFWQMSLGGIIVYHKIKINNKFFNNILSLISIFSVLITIFLVNEQSFFPGFWVLIPTLSSAFIIITKDSFFNKYIVSNKLFVFIGKISYPLYLWHWPLLVYSKMMFPQGSTSIFANKLIIVIISIVLSIITYFVVQKPLRYRKNKIVIFSLIGLMILLSVTTIVFNNNQNKPGQIQLFEQQISQNQSQIFINIQSLDKQKLQIQQKNKLKIKNNLQKINQIQQISQNNKKENKIKQKINPVKQQSEIMKQKQIQKINILKQKQTNINKEQKQNHKQERLQKNQEDKQLKKQQKQNINNLKPLMINQLKPKNHISGDLFPKQNDFYYKNGRKHINSSKNKKRQTPTVQKLRISLKTQHNKGFPIRVPLQSKYFDQQANNTAQKFEILNDGQNNTVFLIGDSHAQFTRFRFLHLFEVANKTGKLTDFPTIIALIKHGMPYLPCHPYFDTSVNYIKKFKPKRVLLVVHWNTWLHWYNRNGLTSYYKCPNGKRNSYQDIVQALKILKQKLSQMVNLGIQVHVATINIQGVGFHPRKMYDMNGIIQNNLKPKRLSEFKMRNKEKIQLLQNTIKQSGAKIIDFSDNLCWQDICQVTTPYGYAVTCDQDHIRSDYSKYWLSSIDHLTEF